MKEIKVLFIANSFGDDTTYFMPYIAKDFDVKLVTANLYIGGCEVFKHLNNIRNDLKAYEYRLFDNDNMTWTNRNDVSIKEALLERKWDYIVLQEASHLSGVKDTYKLVPELILEIKKIINYNPTFVWNMTWAYAKTTWHPCYASNYQKSQEFMYNGILENISHIKDIEDIKLIIPNGKVIQAGRDIFDENLLHLPDGFHMSQPLGRYIAALTAIKTILGVDISKSVYIPDCVTKNDQEKCFSLVKFNA